MCWISFCNQAVDEQVCEIVNEKSNQMFFITVCLIMGLLSPKNLSGATAARPLRNSAYLVINCKGTGEYFATALPFKMASAVSTPIEPIRAAC